MKRNILFRLSLSFSIFTIFIIACTNNPFFDDKVSSDNKLNVSGTVKLNDGSAPDNVYIWLEGFDISTRTDKRGNFELTLPSPQLQAGAGLTGGYKIYYYIANYEYATSSVLIRNGRFEYGSKDLDKTGNISKTITLRKILDVQTIINSTDFMLPDTILNQDFPDTVYNNEDSLLYIMNDPSLNITIQLTNLMGGVKVQSYKLDENKAACVIFRKADDPESKSHYIFNELSTVLSSQEINSVTKWQINLDWYEITLEPGTYIFRPFLIILQDGLPQELLNSFGKKAYRATPEYLNVPYKLETDSIKIVAGCNRAGIKSKSK